MSEHLGGVAWVMKAVQVYHEATVKEGLEVAWISGQGLAVLSVQLNTPCIVSTQLYMDCNAVHHIPNGSFEVALCTVSKRC